LYGRENLGGVLGFFFLKTLENLKKFPKRGGFDPQNPSLNTPLIKLYDEQHSRDVKKLRYQN